MNEDTINNQANYKTDTEIDQGKIQEATRIIIEAIGENPDRQGLRGCG